MADQPGSKDEEEGEEEKPWDPADEEDPVKLQKEFMKVAKEFLGPLKEQAAADKARKREMENAQLEAAMATPPLGRLVGAYKPPTFAEVSAKCKRCWDEIKKIAPDASPFVQAEILRSLLHTPDEDDEDDGAVSIP